MPLCPCCSHLPYADCCAPFIEGTRAPHTPEALMRSRYTAYTRNDLHYLQRTMQGKAAAHVPTHAPQLKWIKLEVIHASSTDDTHGQVEFKAYYAKQDKLHILHEVSQFEKLSDHWYYVDGDLKPFVSQKFARNDLCYCGSGLKYKKCCGP